MTSDTGPFDFDGNYGDEYEAIARGVIPGYLNLFPMVAAILDPDLPQRGRVLVVGAGTGIELVSFKEARPDLRVHGVDPSAQMLELAKRRVREADIANGVSFQLGYARDVATKPPFDAATLINVLHFVPDNDGPDGKAALLRAMARSIEPGGVFVLFDLYGDPASDEYALYMPAWRRYWTLMGMDPAARSVFDERIRRGIHFASKARLLELAAAAGFTAPRRFYKSLLYGGWTFRRTPD